MSPERNNRTYDQVTADTLIKRLTTEQLLKLVGLEKYGVFQNDILSVLQTKSGFSLDDFRKVHSSLKGCEVVEVETGETINLYGSSEDGDWLDKEPLRRLRCNNHSNVASVEFFNHYGVVEECPFRHRSRY